MADTVKPWYQDPDTLARIVSAAATLYGLGKGSGSTPNTYPVPLTPGEQEAQAAKRNLFDYTGAYNDQFLRGLNNATPSWSPTSPLLGPNGGGGFMGGVQIPHIDWSKMPARPTSGGTPSGAQSPPPGTTGSAPTDGVAGDPFGHLGAPAGSPGDAFGDWPAPSGTAHNVTWDDIKRYGPQAIQFAMSLMAGGIPWSQIVQAVTSRFGGQTLPPGKDYSGIDLTPAGSTLPPGKDYSGIDLTPAGYKPPRNIEVGGNLGAPGQPPPGYNPFEWYKNYFGGGWSGFGDAGGTGRLGGPRGNVPPQRP